MGATAGTGNQLVAPPPGNDQKTPAFQTALLRVGANAGLTTRRPSSEREFRTLGPEYWKAAGNPDVSMKPWSERVAISADKAGRLNIGSGYNPAPRLWPAQ